MNQKARNETAAQLAKAIDRIDRRQTVFVSKHYSGEDEREKLLDKLNRIVANLAEEETPGAATETRGRRAGRAGRRRIKKPDAQAP